MDVETRNKLDTTPKEEGHEATPRDVRSEDLLNLLKGGRRAADLRGVQPSALAYLLARSLRTVRHPVLCIVPTDREAERFAANVAFFLGEATNGRGSGSKLDRRVWTFPSRTAHKAQSLGKMETTARRLETLYALKSGPSPVLVVTSALALMERVVPPDVFMKATEYLVKEETVDLETFVRTLAERGYYRVSLVEEYGDMSVRGGVLDIFAPLYRHPLRLEFYGDEIESIRLFHSSSQRSLEALEDVILLPGNEIILDEAARERARKAVYDDVRNERLSPSAGNVWLEKIQEGHQLGAFEAVFSVFYDSMTTLRDYLDPNTIVVWTDTARIGKEMDETAFRLAADWEENRTPNEWRRPPSELFEDPAAIRDGLAAFQNLRVNALVGDDESREVLDMRTEGHEALALAVRSHPNKERLLEPVAGQFRRWREEGVLGFLVCHQKEQARRIAELLEGYGMDALWSERPFGEESFESAAVKVLVGELDKGFVWRSEGLAVVSEEEIFGRKRQRQARRSLSGLFLSSFQDLHAGDYIVHVDHGIGVYRQLTHLNVRGVGADFLLLEYQDGDKLYVPVDKLQKVQKFLGLEGQEPNVDRLGGKSWEAAKRKARESAERIAEELLQLYAHRQVGEGHRFSVPDKYFQEFEATFAYEETPDQARAIEEVIEDMASPRPMDRLICGDVGYGKTEVALRAAFKAVMDGKQVAILVPTTILAEQHYQAFLDRFEGFPVVVASLSRFKTAAQQKQVVDGLVKGSVDIVVGTHRLLQKDIAFRDLGLLIIDEEHRFGVKHKERMKQIRVSVDVLTLTATPIPRTLHMALSGIRDLSTIETPPQDRHAIETTVCKYDEFTIREAVYRELRRGGQVFFVHNHVQSIYQMGTLLQKLVPEARVAVAHGQMKERELEKVMLEFIKRKVDVLVCTTIIESGLDIPAANTIIINRADKFGLAQIYQLRGRVGRSNEQAFAYLLIPDEHLITRDAQKRLRALLDFSELGAGFKIALNDLQIRGGGTILGSAQSGHIAAVGYELYLELLEGTIRRMKGEQDSAEAVDTEVNLSVPAFLPEEFIPDTDQRLMAYKRLATVATEVEVEDLAGEWRDRYGPFPESVRNLVLLAKVRLVLKQMRVLRLDGDEETFTLLFASDVDTRLLQAQLGALKCTFTTDASGKLRIEIWGKNVQQRLLRLKRILQEPGERVNQAKLNQYVT